MTCSARQTGAAASTCPGCGKVRHLSRPAAKRSAKMQGRRMRAYRCGDFWHLTSYQPHGRAAWYRERAARVDAEPLAGGGAERPQDRARSGQGRPNGPRRGTSRGQTGTGALRAAE